MLKIYHGLKKLKKPVNKCFFICSLSLAWPDGFNVTVSGKVEGIFIWPPRVEKGFGYDPIFLPDGFEESFAQMSVKRKNEISHRGLAVKKLIEFLKNKR